MATNVELAIAAGKVLAERWGEPLTLDTLKAGCREVARAVCLQGERVRAGDLYEPARAQLGWS